MEQVVAASRVNPVESKTSLPSDNSWRYRIHRLVAMNAAANNTMPFQPSASPAAANVTSVSHSIVTTVLPGRVWEKTSV